MAVLQASPPNSSKQVSVEAHATVSRHPLNTSQNWLEGQAPGECLHAPAEQASTVQSMPSSQSDAEWQPPSPPPEPPLPPPAPPSPPLPPPKRPVSVPPQAETRREAASETKPNRNRRPEFMA